MQRIILSFLILPAVFLIAGCQTLPTTQPPPPYDELAAAIAAGDDVDAGILRRSFLELPDTSERLQEIVELERQALVLLADEPLRLGAIGNAIIELNYASLTGHLALQRFYNHLESTEATAHHTEWVERLQLLIEQTNGEVDSPYRVYSSAEAEAYLKSRELELVGSMYHSRDDFPFMLLTASKAKADGAEQMPQRLRNAYFDLSDAYRAAESAIDPSPTADEFSPGVLIGYLAQQGDTAAQAFIGAYMASENRTDEAIQWLSAASQRGNLIANLMLARAYWSKTQANTGTERDGYRQLMLDNYTHAIALGSDEAMFSLGSIYLAGEFGEDNQTTGVTLLEQSAELQNPSSALLLAHMHYRGEVVEKNLDTAEDYFHGAASYGSRRARMQYARFLIDPANERTFKDQALVWLEELASENDPEAMIMLGNLHARGVGVSKNHKQALSWFKSAVSTNDTDANIVNEVAWTLTVTHMPTLRNESYALQIMDHMMNADANARNNPAYLDTWAAAYAANGEFKKAVELQKQALAFAKEQQQLQDLSELEEHLQTFTEEGTVTNQVP